MSHYSRLALLLAAELCFLSSCATAAQAEVEAVPPSPAVEALQPKLRHRHPDAVPRQDCFPLESLSPEDRSLSEKLLLDALDSEALYTLVGQLKPVSEGFFQARFRIDPPDLKQLQSIQRALGGWKCGREIEAGTLVFAKLQQGERYFSAWVANRDSLEEAISRQANFFGTLGLTPSDRAELILLQVERAAESRDRWKGFGHLFGYPDPAVDFFVQAGLHQSETGEFVQRDFRQYPTHSRQEGGFVYAVPKLQSESDTESDLRSKVNRILEDYRQRRDAYVGPGKAGALELLRDWWDDGSGWCHPTHAINRLKLEVESPKADTKLSAPTREGGAAQRPN